MTETTEEIITCVDCEEQIDPDDYYRYLDDGGALCQGCEQSEFESASTALFIGADGDRSKALVTNRFAVDAEYHEDTSGLTRIWKSSNAWRGYYETSIEGYVEIPGLTGWTTGWADETVARKIDFNTWVEKLWEDDESDPPVDVAVVMDPTSNVFSTAIGVHVKAEDVETFLTWLGTEFDILTSALG
jgi:hypothetical protein